MDEKDIKFVARHYRKGAFSAGTAWRKMGLAPHSWWSKARIAAAFAGLVVVSVTAAVIANSHSDTDKPAAESVTTQPENTLTAVRTIDFENAALTTVVAEINVVYGVEVINLPVDADSCRLSLHYEGNVCDLIEHINEILDTDLVIKQ